VFRDGPRQFREAGAERHDIGIRLDLQDTPHALAHQQRVFGDHDAKGHDRKSVQIRPRLPMRGR
jgi:hypothetical protein